MTTDPRQLVEVLTARGETIATAESLTGGQLAALFTSVPGASACFLGGVVSYATAVKASLLSVSESVIDKHGVVSAECAGAMASGARTLLGATYGVATTGVAGPDRQEDKPVGLVWVAVAGPEGVQARMLDLEGDRATIQAGSCRGALSVLDGMLRMEDSGLG
ncbi:MAG: CinA family protein [Nocardioides sp.]|uniref:CinA family protein n=1 Tax=Nocardioides sp. TaxID=35761 RepID=UPI002618C1CF|nr:CinA family protein [Nocardioides sp.]MCW2834034.1 CinA family protein [Nocardioides sp.]